MSERDALMQAILERPDDDAPRLVFADWLDDNGEADLARYVRLERAGPRAPPEAPAVAQRQEGLRGLEEVGDAWAAEWRRGLDEEARASLEFAEITRERGLYSEAVISAHGVGRIAPFRRAWDHLLTRTPMRKVHLAGV